MIDLHTHSTASDGTFSPTQLVEHAYELGVSVLALTDHDTIDGIHEARICAEKYGITFLHGIEFNIEIPFGEFHLLGYGMDLKDKDFLNLISESTNNRTERNKQLCEMLFNNGIPITYKSLRERFSGQIGRPHISKMLQELGVVKSVQEGFDKFLANGKQFYLKTKGLDFQKTISIIKKAKGVAVLAHPMSLYLSWRKLEAKIAELQSLGLEAIESWNTGTKPPYCRRLEKLAKQRGLAVTAGSDFHGKNKRGHRLGLKSDGTAIDDYYYTENLLPLLKAAQNLNNN